MTSPCNSSMPSSPPPTWSYRVTGESTPPFTRPVDQPLWRSDGQLASVATRNAVRTTAGNLPSARVIHTVGPIWCGGQKSESGVLGHAYASSLQIAARNGAKTIAFSSISTGAYRYPIEHACHIAIASMKACAPELGFTVMRLVLFSDGDTATHHRALFRGKTRHP